MNAYRAMMRRKLLEEIYDSLSPEDRRTFVHMTMEDKGWNEILQSLGRQERRIADIDEKVSRQTWLSDFSSNIAGNALWDGLVWLGSRLMRKL
jgi:hypothetical protein